MSAIREPAHTTTHTFLNLSAGSKSDVFDPAFLMKGNRLLLMYTLALSASHVLATGLRPSGLQNHDWVGHVLQEKLCFGSFKKLDTRQLISLHLPV
jgi:hypothetical protein